MSENTPNVNSDTMKRVSPEMVKALRAPLPKEAIKPHASKPYLSSIKVIYVVERLNDVFGLGSWFVRNEIIEANHGEKMVIVKATLTVPEYGIAVEQFGGHDNVDRGDAYKGACTDALSKIGSYLYVGMDVYKGFPDGPTPNKDEVPTKKEPFWISATIDKVKVVAAKDGNEVWLKVREGKVVSLLTCSTEPMMSKVLDGEGARKKFQVTESGKKYKGDDAELKGTSIYTLHNLADVPIEDLTHDLQKSIENAVEKKAMKP